VKELKMRALGPYLVESLYERLFPEGAQTLPEEAKRACFITIRAQVIREGDFHPNVLLFIRRFLAETKINTQSIPDISIQEALKILPAEVHPLILETLLTICAINGHASKQEKKLLEDLRIHCGAPPCLDRLDQYLRFVIYGELLPKAVTPKEFIKPNQPS